MNFISIMLLSLLGLAPALWAMLKQRRLARLAKAEMRIAQAVTAMEGHLLKGSTSKGMVYHDLVFQTMLKVQRTRRYQVRWNLFKSPSPSQAEMRQRLDSELAAGEAKFEGEVASFCAAYFEAFGHKHPIQQKLYLFYLSCVGAGAKGLLLILRQLLGRLDRNDQLRQQRARQFFIEASTLDAESGSGALRAQA